MARQRTQKRRPSLTRTDFRSEAARLAELTFPPGVRVPGYPPATLTRYRLGDNSNPAVGLARWIRAAHKMDVPREHVDRLSDHVQSLIDELYSDLPLPSLEDLLIRDAQAAAQAEALRAEFQAGRRVGVLFCEAVNRRNSLGRTLAQLLRGQP
jgi:hypothetical protein